MRRERATVGRSGEWSCETAQTSVYLLFLLSVVFLSKSLLDHPVLSSL